MVRRESETRRDLERMHLVTIGREKMRLQQELEKLRVKGQHLIGKRSVNNAGKNAKLLSRFGTLESDGSVDPRLRTTSVARTDKRTASPKSVRRNVRTQSNRERGPGLPQIGVASAPLKDELELRRINDQRRDPNTKLSELIKSEGWQQNLLSLKVDQFTHSLTPVSPAARSPLHSHGSSPPLRLQDNLHADSSKDLFANSEYAGEDWKESTLDTRATLPGTFPLPNKMKTHRISSISEFDPSDAKKSQSRLIPIDADDNNVSSSDNELAKQRRDGTLRQISEATVPSPFPRKHTVIRRQSQVAILERHDTRSNKYTPSSDSSPGHFNHVPGSPKKSTEAELNLALLGRNAKRVKEIIENREIVFDQEKYAPDGALRTVHMLPNADGAYSQARRARYLRWRDPEAIDLDRDLSIHEIFAKHRGDL